jgi:DNA polymerase-3 subunit delta
MIVVLTGNNSFGLQESLRGITKDFTKDHGNSVERFDAVDETNADMIVDAVRSISFLEPRKLVIVRNFGQNKDLLEKIESVVDQTAESTDLLLVDEKLDKRTSAYKYLKKTCEVRLFEEMNPYELEGWIAEEAKKMKVNINRSDIKFLIDRVGPNQQLLYHELAKLNTYSSEITKNSIFELIEPTPQSKVFDMLEALFDGNAVKAHELYIDQRAQGEDPHKLLAMITWQLQQLTLAVFAPDRSVSNLTSTGMSPYSAQKALQLAEKINKEDIKFFVTELAQIDMLSKTSADVESALAVYFSEVNERLHTKY